MNNEQRAAAKCLIRVIALAIRGEELTELPEGVSFPALWEQAKANDLTVMAYEGIKGILPGDELARWMGQNNIELALDINQQEAYEEVVSLLTGNGIRLLPLKGFALKDTYPYRWYRHMADLDFLIDVDHDKVVRDLLARNGYEVDSFRSGHDDQYVKKPYIYLEMHISMAGSTIPGISRYYDDPWSRAVPTERPLVYAFSWSDYYIYMVVHMAKHYYSGGIGIRFLLDVYMFLKSHEKDLDREYVAGELCKMDLAEFCSDMEEIAGNWFGDSPAGAAPQRGSVSGQGAAEGEYPDNCTERQRKLSLMEDFILRYGTFGDSMQSIRGLMEQTAGDDENEAESRLKYVMTRLFPDLRYMRERYRFLFKIPALLPAAYIMRIFSTIRNRDAISRINTEMDVIRDSAEDQGEG